MEGEEEGEGIVLRFLDRKVILLGGLVGREEIILLEVEGEGEEDLGMCLDLCQ